MRRSEKEVTDRKEIDAIIDGASLCRVGLVDGDEAYIVPMNFGYSEGCLWFHCAKEGRKMQLIERTGKACFEIDIDEGLVLDEDAFKCSNKFKCVMGTGRIGMVTSREERAKGIDALMRHYYKGEYSITEKCMGKTAVIKLEIDSISCKVNYR